MPEPLAYLNGRISPISQTTLSIFDMGIVMGASVTEMARTFHHEPFRIHEHVERLFRSVRHVGFDVDLTRDALIDLAKELIDHNARLIPPHHDLGLSMFITAGTSLVYTGYAGMSTYRKPTICVHTFPLPFELWAEKYTLGQHVVTPSIRHLPPECLDPKIKSRSRMHWYLADEQARLVDPKAIALLIDRQDNITETSTANFFIVQPGKLITPSGRNTLHGVSQQVIFELAEQFDLRFEQRDIQTYDVINADEAFTTSTPYCLLPVTMINGRPIGTGRPGPVYDMLLKAWSH
ncbi:MAG TPA: aminotransferase class IV, partial [Planctomycetaceae bacterium]|nr:aminotransferase class IV [Planctomycetaceae bacterium]